MFDLHGYILILLRIGDPQGHLHAIMTVQKVFEWLELRKGRWEFPSSIGLNGTKMYHIQR